MSNTDQLEEFWHRAVEPIFIKPDMIVVTEGYSLRQHFTFDPFYLTEIDTFVITIEENWNIFGDNKQHVYELNLREIEGTINSAITASMLINGKLVGLKAFVGKDLTPQRCGLYSQIDIILSKVPITRTSKYEDSILEVTESED